MSYNYTFFIILFSSNTGSPTCLIISSEIISITFFEYPLILEYLIEYLSSKYLKSEDKYQYNHLKL